MHILRLLNAEAGQIFDGSRAKLNHVLAQICHNTTAEASTTGKEQKAKIKGHSDKMKDMPSDGGLMAFCTFYDERELRQRLMQGAGAKNNAFGHDIAGRSGLTKLVFRLIEAVCRRELRRRQRRRQRRATT